MPIIVDWGNLEETIIVWKFRNRWDETDFYDAVERSATLTQSTDACVDYIIDLRQSISSPPNLLAMSRAAIQNHNFENQGRTAVITKSSFWQQLFDTLLSSVRHFMGHVMFVDSVDAAYDVIAQAQQTHESRAVGD